MTDRRPLALGALLAASTVSTAGTRISQIAVPWLVLETTKDPLLTGLVGTAEIAPYVVLQLLGSPLVDRLGARRTAIAGNVVAGAAMALLPALHVAGLLSVPIVLGLVFVAGARPVVPPTQRPRCSSLQPPNAPERRSSGPPDSWTVPSAWRACWAPSPRAA